MCVCVCVCVFVKHACACVCICVGVCARAEVLMCVHIIIYMPMFSRARQIGIDSERAKERRRKR